MEDEVWDAFKELGEESPEELDDRVCREQQGAQVIDDSAKKGRRSYRPDGSGESVVLPSSDSEQAWGLKVEAQLLTLGERLSKANRRLQKLETGWESIREHVLEQKQILEVHNAAMAGVGKWRQDLLTLKQQIDTITKQIDTITTFTHSLEARITETERVNERQDHSIQDLSRELNRTAGRVLDLERGRGLRDPAQDLEEVRAGCRAALHPYSDLSKPDNSAEIRSVKVTAVLRKCRNYLEDLSTPSNSTLALIRDISVAIDMMEGLYK